MFVNLRELGKQTQVITDFGVPVIRLHALDVCKNSFGNSRKNMGKTVIGRDLLGNVEPQRKQAVLLPVSGELDVPSIHLDEIERDVIQGGSDLMHRFPGNDSHDGVRISTSIYFLFVVRMLDDFVRVTASVSSNVLSYSVDMFRCPDELEFGGFDTSNDNIR